MFRKLRQSVVAAAVVAAIWGAQRDADAQPPSAKDEIGVWSFSVKVPKIYDFNIEWSTMGGRQVWSDIAYRDGWRIQRNALTEHYRVLDNEDVRRAWGPEDHCQKKFAEFVTSEKLNSAQGKVVVILHGLGRSRKTMQPMADYLGKRGYTVLNLAYASTRESVDVHAAGLAKIIAQLPKANEINFVGHSLGNIVIRRYLALTLEKEGKVDPRLHRMVMLGPPNQGARLARLVKDTGIFDLVAGKSGYQLSKDWKSLDARLTRPPFEFGIIAGNQGRNPLLPGEDDLVVSVEETKLPGAHDFLVLPVFHTRMMKSPDVHEKALRFLRKGYFVSSKKRSPLPVEKAKSDESED